MFSRATYLAAILTVLPCLAAAQVRRPASPNSPFPPQPFFRRPLALDAGTDPYLTTVQPGTPVNIAFVNIVEYWRVFTELRLLVNGLRDSRTQELEPEELQKKIEQFRGQVEGIAKATCERWLRDPSALRDSLVRPLDSITKLLDQPGVSRGLIMGALQRAIDAGAAAEEVVSRDAVNTTTPANSTGLKLGAFLERNAQSYAFGSVAYSPGESVLNARSNLRTVAFVTATETFPLNPAELPPPGSTGPPPDTTGEHATTRLGLGLLYGDPDHWLAGGTIASLFGDFDSLFPAPVDAGVSAAYRVGLPTHAPIESQPLDLPGLEDDSVRRAWVTDRRLLEHVRPGDLWLTGGARYLAGFNNFPTGAAFEGSALYALCHSPLVRHASNNPTLATTVTLTGTYCAQHALGLDEFSVEFRTPIAGESWDAPPVFLSARFGTRGDCTIALETRF